MNTIQLKESTDLRMIIQSDLGRPVSQGGKAWSFRCPFHGESHGAALAVWSNGWRCFGACNEGGDAIAWMMKRFQLDFKEAVQSLGGQLDRARPASQPPVRVALNPAEPPPAAWQTIAREIADRAVDCLWSEEGEKALRYLREQRGLWDSTIEDQKLGFIPGDFKTWHTYREIKIPAGISIPWYAGGHLWGIKVRRSAGEQRYQQVSGGSLRDSLYLADIISPKYPTLVVEGEFNALSGLQHIGDLVNVVSVGTSGTVLNPRWFELLLSSADLYALYDHDPAGEKGAERLRQCTDRITGLQLPDGFKDLNEFATVTWQAKQVDAVEDWFFNATAKRG